MGAILGTRKRFLYRIVVYALAPWVGLYVFLTHPNEPEGRLVGLIGIFIGAAAITLLLARLSDPWGALRYAFRPLGTVQRAIRAWQPEGETWDPIARDESLRAHLSSALPDVEIEERHTPAAEGAFAFGGELLLLWWSPARHATTDEIEDLRRRIRDLRTPLHEEPVLLLVLEEISADVAAELRQQVPNIHLVKLGS